MKNFLIGAAVAVFVSSLYIGTIAALLYLYLKSTGQL